MRIGIVSDVHGNANGLTTALDRMGEVDTLLCAGDMVEEFRFSNATVEILQDSGALCVLGNHDLGLLSEHGTRARTAPGVRADLVAWVARQPTCRTLDVGGKRLLLTHASPYAPHTQYVLPHSPELRRIGEVDADFVVLGHTHVQMIERVGRVLVINPGSVGQARDNANGRQLSCAVLDTDDEHVTIDDYTLDGSPHPVAARGGEGDTT